MEARGTRKAVIKAVAYPFHGFNPLDLNIGLGVSKASGGIFCKPMSVSGGKSGRNISLEALTYHSDPVVARAKLPRGVFTVEKVVPLIPKEPSDFGVGTHKLGRPNID